MHNRFEWQLLNTLKNCSNAIKCNYGSLEFNWMHSMAAAVWNRYNELYGSSCMHTIVERYDYVGVENLLGASEM